MPNKGANPARAAAMPSTFVEKASAEQIAPYRQTNVSISRELVSCTMSTRGQCPAIQNSTKIQSHREGEAESAACFVFTPQILVRGHVTLMMPLKRWRLFVFLTINKDIEPVAVPGAGIAMNSMDAVFAASNTESRREIRGICRKIRVGPSQDHHAPRGKVIKNGCTWRRFLSGFC